MANSFYVQRFHDEELYFHHEGYLKNKNASGMMVTLDLTRPRAKPRKKKISVHRSFSDLWKPIDIPENVMKAFFGVAAPWTPL